MSYLKDLREGLRWLDLHLIFQAVLLLLVLNSLPKLVDGEVAQFYLQPSVSEIKTGITLLCLVLI